MIKTVEMYVVECDNCHCVDEDAEYSCYSDKSWAVEEVYNAGWIEHEDKHYCPKCFTIDDDDNVQILTK